MRRQNVRLPVDLSWMDVTRWPDWPLWHCTGLNESGGSWTFVQQGGAHSGWAATAATTWQGYGPAWIVARWPRPEWAPPWAQIVADREIRRRVGSGQWGGLEKCGG